MTNQNLLHDLEELLQQDQSLISDGHLLKNAVIERALKLDADLLGLLLQSDTIKQHFFTQVGGTLVFDKVKFQEFVSNKAFLPDSFTSFKNRIGLTNGQGYLKQSRDVVLAWPYKDCVLEGGMTKEDKGKTEVFWNTTLAPDDISRLFEPKVMTGWECWDEEAVKAKKSKQVSQITETDNLLIKGNNLLALHSLKKRYAGRVKLIYIDPPYNTGSDEFKYNDRFNHSSWLTFMKNRLEVAKQLLSTNGAIFVQIGDQEVAFLKVLMDEIFPDQFINHIAVRTKSPSGFKTVNQGVFETLEHILVYGKSRQKWAYNPQFTKSDYDSNYKWEILNRDAPPNQWNIRPIIESVVSNLGVRDKKLQTKNLAKNQSRLQLHNMRLKIARVFSG